MAVSARTMREDARELPIVEDADVCVVGGSCTGVFAAVAAARLGAKVVLIENHGFFGGTATAGLVCSWSPLLDARNSRPIVAGLTAEILDRLGRRKGVLTRVTVHRAPQGGYMFNPEELKIELDELVTEHGVRPFLHARFVAAAAEEGTVRAAVVEDKSGRRAITARQFVDATGDADVAYRAGLECFAGSTLQPPTTCAMIAGFEALERQNPGFSLNRIVFDPRIPTALRQGFLWWQPAAGQRGVRLVAGTRVSGADCSDADQLTRAEVEGRRQVRVICDILRDHCAGGDGVSLAALAAHIGIRQTRQVRCLHRLTEREVLSGRRFADAIANSCFRVDLHHSDREGVTFRYLDGSEVRCRADGTTEGGRWRPEQAEDPAFYQIPYRCLVPAGAKNLLVAGRCIDADEGAHGSVRVMVNTNQMGEAAGSAAYLALESGRPVAEIDSQRLRGLMGERGALVI